MSEVAVASQELKATRVHFGKKEDHPCDLSFSGRADAVCHAAGDLRKQVENKSLFVSGNRRHGKKKNSARKSKLKLFSKIPSQISYRHDCIICKWWKSRTSACLMSRCLISSSFPLSSTKPSSVERHFSISVAFGTQLTFNLWFSPTTSVNHVSNWFHWKRSSGHTESKVSVLHQTVDREWLANKYSGTHNEPKTIWFHRKFFFFFLNLNLINSQNVWFTM